MRVFVISWFFPPINSSEGMVTYKLLRNSKHRFTICSSRSKNWSYEDDFFVKDENLDIIALNVSDFHLWGRKVLEIFEEENTKHSFDAVMSRTMPPESIDIAAEIKRKHPDIPWIASINDPISKNPYHILELFERNATLEKEKVDEIFLSLNVDSTRPVFSFPHEGYFSNLKRQESLALEKADALLFPCKELAEYCLDDTSRDGVYIIPHTFDKSLVRNSSRKKSGKVKSLSFIGHSDSVRTLLPIAKAVALLKKNDSKLSEKLKVRFIGHVPEDVRAYIYNFFLYDVIDVVQDMPYSDCLKAMEASDWLIHVDAYFERLGHTGGSVFFAGKLAEYASTTTPILAFTGRESPAAKFTEAVGGIVCDIKNVKIISNVLESIASGFNYSLSPANIENRRKYDATRVALNFDKAIEEISSKAAQKGTSCSPVLTLGVYAHNAESVIDRCITSAVSCRELNDLQIVVLDDGSSDETLKKLYSWKSRFSSTITIIHLENMEGYGAALQKEISASHGLYFKVVDANDWVDPKNLDNLIQEIKRWKIIPDIIDASYCLIGARDGNLTQVKKTSNQAEYGHVYSLNKSRISYLPMVGPNLFYLTEKLQQAEIEFSTEEPFAKFEYILLPLRWLDTIIFIDYSVYRLSVVDEFENGFTPIGCTQDNSNINIFLKCVLGWYGEFEQVFKNTRRLGYVNEIIAGQLLLPYYGLILRQVRNKWVALRTVEQFDDLLKENSPALYKELE